MIEIAKLQQLCNPKNIVLTEHARQRLVERKISIQDILHAITTGKIIKQYEDDKPFASCLVLGIATNQKPLHLVLSHMRNLFILLPHIILMPASGKLIGKHENKRSSYEVYELFCQCREKFNYKCN